MSPLRHRTPGDTDARRRSRLRTAAWSALLVVGALLAVVAWATASPPGSSPDEDFHLTSIWCPMPIDGSCETRVGEEGETQVAAPHVVVSAALCTAFQPDNSGACVDGLGNDKVWASRLNDGLYPGGFYDVMHWFVGPDVPQSVTNMRIANGLVAIALFTAVAVLSPPASRRVLAYGFLTVSVPLGVYLIASINPSSWAVTGVAVAWAGMHGFMTQPDRRRRYGLAAVALLAAVLTATARADAGAYLGVVAAGVVALHIRTVRARVRTGILPLLVTAIGVVGFLSASQTGALTGMYGTQGPGDGDLFFANLFALPSLLLGAQTESLNWLDTPVPPIAWVPLVLVAGALAFRGMRVVDVPKGVALLGMVGVYVALPLLVLQLSGTPVGLEVQARYVAPLVPAIMATTLWTPCRGGMPRLGTGQSALVYASLVGAHAVILHIQIRRFVTGLDVGGLNLNSAVEWWGSPVSPMATWFLGSLGFAVLALVLFRVQRADPSDERPELTGEPLAAVSPALTPAA
ncbi:DUF2142 domain-containing protein [Xylanimonas ulmi]|uniref:Putative membrane protein DUF2142 n=1 Tax=Xylanimonas ulmi TaxID=228973 RepID=A0A4Q7LZU3_9MICO|nr:DUF2142 domain-containing protein [Xylanibacterium ulmi]RZS59957.1 putative membrane protein DUF2142 [Xylanibacterium ulmi]